jgi:hypothetical protein
LFEGGERGDREVQVIPLIPKWKNFGKSRQHSLWNQVSMVDFSKRFVSGYNFDWHNCSPRPKRYHLCLFRQGGCLLCKNGKTGTKKAASKGK